jgi:hypothetical protein
MRICKEVEMDAAVAALIGAAIGTLGSVAGVWLSQRHQTKRDLVRSAVELGQAEREERRAKLATTTGGHLLPVSVYVAQHAAVLQAIAEGRFGPDTLRAIDEEQIELVEQLAENIKSREAAAKRFDVKMAEGSPLPVHTTPRKGS